MTRYHFPIFEHEKLYADPDGKCLADDEAAKAYARRVINELKCDFDTSYAGYRIEVVENERMVASLSFNGDDRVLH